MLSTKPVDNFVDISLLTWLKASVSAGFDKLHNQWAEIISLNIKGLCFMNFLSFFFNLFFLIYFFVYKCQFDF